MNAFLKKGLSMLLALSLAASLLSFTAFAEEEDFIGSEAISSEVLPGGDLPAAPPAEDPETDPEMAVGGDSEIDPALPEVLGPADMTDEADDGLIGGELPLPTLPDIVIDVDNSLLPEDMMDQPAAPPAEETVIDAAMAVEPENTPELLALSENIFTSADEYEFDYTHWVRKDPTIAVQESGILIGSGTDSWYTYCVDSDLRYPASDKKFINFPRADLPNGEKLNNKTLAIEDDIWHITDEEQPLYRLSADELQNQAVLAKILEAGYPQEAVVSVKAIADRMDLSPSLRAFYTQQAVWAVTTGHPDDFLGAPYINALYEYATENTVDGVPITAPEQIAITGGVDQNGQISLTYQEKTGLWSGKLTLSAAPADLKLSYISDDITVSTEDGRSLAAGDLVTETVLVLSAHSADITGSIRFSYNVRQEVGTDLSLFETDATWIRTEMLEGITYITEAVAFQRMLGFDVTETQDQLTALILGVNQPAPDPDPAPGHDTDHSDRPDREPAVDIPEADVPLAELPAAEEASAAEDLPDADVPLAEVPQTGDASWLWAGMAAASLAALAWLALSARKQYD